MVPWNNQVLFFAMAYYFWLFAGEGKEHASWRLVIASGVVSGFSMLAREEAALFVVPMLAAYLVMSRAGWKKWVVAFGVAGVCFLPQVLLKLFVLGSASDASDRGGYGRVLGEYFSPSSVRQNIWGTIINGRNIEGINPLRPALLQAQPWLWFSPIGMGAIVLMKKIPTGVKLFVVVSCVVILFYLSGENMSAAKLRFHCLRYISPGFIALNLGVVVAARGICLGGVATWRNMYPKLSLGRRMSDHSTS